MGSVYRRKFTPRDGKTPPKRVSIWWIKYRVQDQIIRESSQTDDLKAARHLLKLREGAAAEGRPIIPRADRLTINDLLDAVRIDYVANTQRVDRLDISLKHLRPALGTRQAVHLKTADIIAYATQRQALPAANATINAELAALKRAYNLAIRGERLYRRPYIPMLKPAPPRKGFFEEAQFEAVRRHLPPDLRALMTVAYITGWRPASELLLLQWRHVDFKAGLMRLDPGMAKNEEGRTFYFTPALRATLDAQRTLTDDWQKRRRRVIPWVFHRRGKPIKDYRATWKKTCAAAGVQRIPHDFRRTAIRNLERRGVPRSVAMQMVGHKTEAVYRRYAIVDDAMLREGAAKLALGEGDLAAGLGLATAPVFSEAGHRLGHRQGSERKRTRVSS